MELAGMGWLHRHSRRIVQLRMVRAISGDTRFSVGESSALWDGRDPSIGRSVPGIRSAADLSRQNFWFDLHGDQRSALRVFRLRNFLRPETGATFGPGAASWSKSARIFLAGSKWKTSGVGRSAFAKWRDPDFLPRPLVTAM